MLPLLVLISCAGGGWKLDTEKPFCVTKCGAEFFEDYGDRLVQNYEPKWTCATLQKGEDLMLKVWARNVIDPRFENACSLIKGARITMAKTVWWTRVDGLQVIGTTYCAESVVQVGNSPLPDGAFLHEMSHWVQRCQTRAPVDPKDPDHSNWKRDGIYAAEQELQLRWKDTP